MTTRGLYRTFPKVRRPAGSPDPMSGAAALAMAQLSRMLMGGTSRAADQLVRRRNDLGVAVWHGRHSARAGRPAWWAYWTDSRGAWWATEPQTDESAALDRAEWMLDHGAQAPGVTFVARIRGCSQLDLLRACGGWSYVRGTYAEPPHYATGFACGARDGRDATNTQ